MATVNTDFTRALNAMVKAIYREAFNPQRGLYNRLATVFPSTLRTELYDWISDVPKLREWVDERAPRSLKDYGFSITNKKWESSISVARDVLEDDQTGQVKFRILQLAEAAMTHYDQLLFDVINSNPTAFDGVAFFHASHANLGTAVFSADALQDALSAMRDQTTPVEAEPMDITPTHLVVPPQLEWDARRVLNSAYWPDATGGGAHSVNPMHALAIELVVTPRLSTNTEWHIYDCSHTVKPWIIQQRIAPEIEMLESDSETGFLRDEFLYGVRCRDNAGPGLYQYGYKSAGTG